MAPADKMLQLERDVAQKLHAHLEHVTSVESAKMAEAQQRLHELNERAIADRKDKDALAAQLAEQSSLARGLEERLNEIEASEMGALRRGAEEFAKVSEARAALELRVSQLEGALQLLSARGEQVARDTGDAVKHMVESKETAILGQLQGAVDALGTQMKGVQAELEHRGAELRLLAEGEGRRREQDLTELAHSAEGQARSLREGVEEVRRRVDAERAAGERRVEEAEARLLAAAEAADAAREVQLEALRSAMGDQKLEMAGVSERALAGVEAARAFLEEVVRAEIRGRMQGQQQLSERVAALEESSRGADAAQAFQQEAHTVLALLQAKAKAHGKSIKALSAEVDAARRSQGDVQGELTDEVRACVAATKAAEQRLTHDLQLQAQAARDLQHVMETRTRALEEGRGAIMDKIHKEVEGNRRADIERAKEVSDKLQSLQQAVDGCVEMCQSDLRELHEAVDAVESRLDKEAEALEELIDKTARDLASTLDDRLQGSMRTAVEGMAEGLTRQVRDLAEGQQRVEGEQEEQMRRIEANRKAMEQRAKQGEQRAEETATRIGVELQRLKDEALAARDGQHDKIDALDEAAHELRAALAQASADAVERQQVLDVKLKRLEYTLLTAPPEDGKAGGAGLIGRLRGAVDQASAELAAQRKNGAVELAARDARLQALQARQARLEADAPAAVERSAAALQKEAAALGARVDSELRAVWAQFEAARKDASAQRAEVDAAVAAEGAARAVDARAAADALEAARGEAARLAEAARLEAVRLAEQRGEAEAALARRVDEEGGARAELARRLEEAARLQTQREEAEAARVDAQIRAQAEAARKGTAAVLQGVQRVQEGVQQLFATAAGLEEAQEAQARDALARHRALEAALAAQAPPPPPPPSRTKWTRRVPHPVLIGHAASLTPY